MTFFLIMFVILALRTLRLFPRLRSNLDAILYMTRSGFLVPLQKLTLVRVEMDIGLNVCTWTFHSNFIKTRNIWSCY